MRSNVVVPIVVLLMVCSVYSSSLSETLSSSDELEFITPSETSEDAQWTSGYECPVESSETCSTAIDAGTTHNDWLELLRTTGDTWPYAAPNSGAALTNIDAVVIKSEDESMMEAYLVSRDRQKLMLEDFYTNNDVAMMTQFEIQRANALSGAVFREAGTEHALHDEVLSLSGGLLELVENAQSDSDIQSDFEDELESIFTEESFSSASKDAQEIMVMMHSIYYASDWYWGEASSGDGTTTARAGGDFWKKVGDAFGVLGGAALAVWSHATNSWTGGGGDDGVGAAIVDSSLQSFKGDDSSGSSGGFAGDLTCNPVELSACIDSLAWSYGYDCPPSMTNLLCTQIITSGSEHNDLLDLLRSTGPYDPYGASDSGGAMGTLDATAVLAFSTSAGIDSVPYLANQEGGYCCGGGGRIAVYEEVRPRQQAMLDDFYANNDVAKMTQFEIQQANALSGAEFRESGTENPLHDEVLALTSDLLRIVRDADSDSDVESDFEAELESIFVDENFGSASDDAKLVLGLTHAVYHASDWYWGGPCSNDVTAIECRSYVDDSDSRVGPNFWKKVGDALGVLGGAALSVWTNSANGPTGGNGDGGLGSAIVDASLQSFKGNSGESPGGITVGPGTDFDPITCDEDNWIGCSMINIGLAGTDSGSINYISVPENWSLINDDRPTKPYDNAGEEKAAIGFYHNSDGWHIFYWESPVTCDDIANADQLWTNMGTDDYLCWDIPAGGALVMFYHRVDVDASIGFATPDGDVTYTASDLVSLEIMQKGEFVDDGTIKNNVHGYFRMTGVGGDDTNSTGNIGEEKSEEKSEETESEESGLPGFTLMPLLIALGAAMFFTRNKNQEI